MTGPLPELVTEHEISILFMNNSYYSKLTDLSEFRKQYSKK